MRKHVPLDANIRDGGDWRHTKNNTNKMIFSPRPTRTHPRYVSQSCNLPQPLPLLK